MPACVSHKLRVTFDRIGRHHDVPPIELEQNEEMAEAIARYARKFLTSGEYVVDVDLDAMRGTIEGGRHGTFTLIHL